MKAAAEPAEEMMRSDKNRTTVVQKAVNVNARCEREQEREKFGMVVLRQAQVGNRFALHYSPFALLVWC